MLKDRANRKKRKGTKSLRPFRFPIELELANSSRLLQYEEDCRWRSGKRSIECICGRDVATETRNGHRLCMMARVSLALEQSLH